VAAVLAAGCGTAMAVATRTSRWTMCAPCRGW